MTTIVQTEEVNIEDLSVKQLAFIEQGLNNIIKGIATDAKANVTSSGHVRTAALRDAITTKVKIAKNNKAVYGLIGIDSKYITYDDKGNKIKPAKYAHFIELGTKEIPASLFLTKAHSKNKQLINNTINNAIKEAAI